MLLKFLLMTWVNMKYQPMVPIIFGPYVAVISN